MANAQVNSDKPIKAFEDAGYGVSVTDGYRYNVPSDVYDSYIAQRQGKTVEQVKQERAKIDELVAQDMPERQAQAKIEGAKAAGVAKREAMGEYAGSYGQTPSKGEDIDWFTGKKASQVAEEKRQEEEASKNRARAEQRQSENRLNAGDPTAEIGADKAAQDRVRENYYKQPQWLRDALGAGANVSLGGDGTVTPGIGGRGTPADLSKDTPDAEKYISQNPGTILYDPKNGYIDLAKVVQLGAGVATGNFEGAYGPGSGPRLGGYEPKDPNNPWGLQVSQLYTGRSSKTSPLISGMEETDFTGIFGDNKFATLPSETSPEDLTKLQQQANLKTFDSLNRGGSFNIQTASDRPFGGPDPTTAFIQPSVAPLSDMSRNTKGNTIFRWA